MRPRSATTRRASAASASASATRRPGGLQQRRQQRPVLRQQERRPGAMDAENISRVPSVYDGDFGGVGLQASVVGLYGELKNDAEDALRRRQMVGRAGGATIDLSASSSPAASATTRSATTHARLLHRRHRLRLRPGEHLAHLRPDLRLERRLRRGDGLGDKAYNLVLSADYRAGAGPGAGWRREQVRQRQRRRDTGTGDKGWPRWAAPPGVLIVRRPSRRAAGHCPAAFVCSGSPMLCYLRHMAVQESLS